MLMNINEVKPDPNQPRRTFNEEKMEALRASMKADGFRKQYPIIINGGNIIVDGERRWRAAKAVGIKEVPVEKKEGVTDFERLMYQLKSEGAELDTQDKYDAWYKLFKLGTKYGKNVQDISIQLGITFKTFDMAVREYGEYLELSKTLSHKKLEPSFTENYSALAEITREKDVELRNKLAEKAVQEKWTNDKAREIRRTIKEQPLKTNEILSHDYSGSHWEMRLEVAKTGFSKDEVDVIQKDSEKAEELFGQIGLYSDIFKYGLQLASSMRKFEYRELTPGKLTEYHQRIYKFMPYVTEHIGKLEGYMVKKGLLKSNNKLIK